MSNPFLEFIGQVFTLTWFVFLRLGLPLLVVGGIGWLLWRFFAPQPVPHAEHAAAPHERFGQFVLRARELPSMELLADRVRALSARQIMAIFVMLMLWIAAAGYLIARFFWGLETATALSDEMPWGLWIAFKLSFVAMAGAGFTFAAIVYVFRLEKYHPLARTAILIGLIGYTTFIVSLIFDLGRWYNIWHPIVMWNPHSVMFEIAWCVMLYTAVLYAEFSPAFFERLGWKRAQKVMRVIVLPLVIAGVVLSTLHQSSLGSLYIVQFTKLSLLWSTPMLPIFFFTSAVAAGLAMMMVVPCINAKAFHCENRQPLLATLAKPAAIVLGIYATLKLADLTTRGELAQLLTPRALSALWWIEFLCGIILPMVILLTPQAQTNPRVRIGAALLVLGGVVLNRFNVALFGFGEYLGALNVTYIPSFGEWVITLALIAAALAAYIAAVKLLPILPQPKQEMAAQRAKAD